MRYSSLERLLADRGEAPAWRAAAVAVEAAPRVLPEVTYSIGDAVTYRLLRRPDRPELTAHRRYLDVRVVLGGQHQVEVARVADLVPLKPYDDLTDREAFVGAGDLQVLQAGEVLVSEPGEAIRDLEVSGEVLLIRVTVEVARHPAPGSATTR
ncbi:MAG: YhcH/YjgK/YiaL family protein [Propioniciclava sp.]